MWGSLFVRPQPPEKIRSYTGARSRQKHVAHFWSNVDQIFQREDESGLPVMNHEMVEHIGAVFQVCWVCQSFCFFVRLFTKSFWDDQSGKPLPADYAEGRLFRAAVWHLNGLNSNSWFMAVDPSTAPAQCVAAVCSRRTTKDSTGRDEGKATETSFFSCLHSHKELKNRWLTIGFLLFKDFGSVAEVGWFFLNMQSETQGRYASHPYIFSLISSLRLRMTMMMTMIMMTMIMMTMMMMMMMMRMRMRMRMRMMRMMTMMMVMMMMMMTTIIVVTYVYVYIIYTLYCYYLYVFCFWQWCRCRRW